MSASFHRTIGLPVKKVQYLKDHNIKTSNDTDLSKWYESRKQYEDFYTEYNSIPTYGPLYTWYHYQQSKFEAGTLTEEQINALENTVGWTWTMTCKVIILQREKEMLQKEKTEIEAIISRQVNIIQQQEALIEKLESDAAIGAISTNN